MDEPVVGLVFLVFSLFVVRSLLHHSNLDKEMDDWVFSKDNMARVPMTTPEVLPRCSAMWYVCISHEWEKF